jgi:two-component system, OmpR family, sensor histidine kinase KdpD
MKKQTSIKTHLINFLKIFLIWLFATIISLTLNTFGWQESTIILTFVLGSIVWTVLKIPYLYGTILTLVNVLTFNYFFTIPYYTFRVDDFQYLFTFISMLIVSSFASYLVYTSNKNRHIAHLRSLNNRYLFQLSELLYQSLDFDSSLKNAKDLLKNTLDSEVTIRIFDSVENVFELIETLDSELREPAIESFMTLLPKKQMFGLNTVSFFPIIIEKEVRGFIIVDGASLSADAVEWMSTIGSILALAKQRVESIKLQEVSKLNYEQEKLRVSLLSSISHDLRTPLASIIGSSTILIDQIQADQKDTLLAKNIYQDAQWLLDSVENILSLIRLNNQNLNVLFQPMLIEEVIEETIQHFGQDELNRININYQHGSQFVNLEARLMVTAFYNLIHNALKFSEKTVYIRTSLQDQVCTIEIVDEGLGISSETKEKIFERFYSTKPLDKKFRQGVGLGLSIVKEIVDAHNGSIHIGNNYPAGTIMSIRLPLYKEDQ